MTSNDDDDHKIVKVSPKHPIAHEPSSAAHAQAFAFQRQNVNYNQTITTTSHITPEYAAALIKVSENEHAVPAKERTARTRILARYRIARDSIAGAVAVAGIYGAVSAPAAGQSIAIVIGSLVGAGLIEFGGKRRKKRPGATRPP